MRGLLNNPSLALEAIKFQSGNFFKELTILFTQLAKVPAKELPESEMLLEMSRIIRAHTGVGVTVMIHNEGPLISLPNLDRNHPLINSFYRDFASSGEGLRRIQETQGKLRGVVDLRSGKVSGIFSDLGSYLQLPEEFVAASQFTPEEKAAVVLHEVGHYMVYCEMIVRSATTNYVLAGLAQELSGTEGAERREVVLMNVKTALKLKMLDPKTLAKSHDPKVINTVVVTSVMREMHSELGSTVYDDYGWEYLADEYTARHGAGRHLVTALDKLNRMTGHRSYRPGPIYVFMEAFKLALAMLPYFGLLLTVAWYVIDASSTVHEDPEARTRRLRNQLVQEMKNKKLAPARYEQLKADLAAIDEVLANVKDRRQWLTVVAQTLLFTSNARKQWDQEKLQKELEGLAMNELFVKAQELRQAA